MTHINILDLSIKELELHIEQFGEKKFRAKQLLNWIYKKNVFNFDLMTNMSEEFKNKLKSGYSLDIPKISKYQQSTLDRSYKFLLETKDQNFIESILILESGRSTLCVSCMIGCPLKCKFCATGSELQFKKNLKTSEILGQFIVIQDFIKEHNLSEKITNIVFMGMGEPLLNLENVEKAIQILTSMDGFGLSKSRITVSTAGVTKNLANFINKYGVKLAVSIHFPTEEQRSEFMPVNKLYSLSQLISELKKINLNKRDFITIEYLMIKDLNDSLMHAKSLLKSISNLKVKINLIPFNPIKTFTANPSSNDTIEKFANFLKAKNIFVTIRKSRGKDTQGACGQFALK